MISYLLFFVGIVSLCAAKHVPHEPPTLRIIGGKEAKPHSAPFMVYFEIQDPKNPKGVYDCGGSLITPSHVLTAAHCLRGNMTINYLVLGAHNIKEMEPTQQNVLASNYVIHKDYGTPPNANDIAIIKLKAPVKIDKNVAVVKLAEDKDASKTYVGQDATAYGWGKIHDPPKAADTDVLRAVDLKVISNADCLKVAPLKNVYAGDICTDGKGPKGTCQGDSGGPLTSNGIQIGVISRGVTKDCETKLPSVYVKVASYAKWIETTLKQL